MCKLEKPDLFSSVGNDYSFFLQQVIGMAVCTQLGPILLGLMST